MSWRVEEEVNKFKEMFFGYHTSIFFIYKTITTSQRTSLSHNDFYKIDLFIKLTIEKNPGAFKEKIKKIDSKEIKIHCRGCQCKKSGCLKAYCECFAAGILCTGICRCSDCKNFSSDIPQQELQIMKDINKRNRKRSERCAAAAAEGSRR